MPAEGMFPGSLRTGSSSPRTGVHVALYIWCRLTTLSLLVLHTRPPPLNQFYLTPVSYNRRVRCMSKGNKRPGDNSRQYCNCMYKTVFRCRSLSQSFFSCLHVTCMLSYFLVYICYMHVRVHPFNLPFYHNNYTYSPLELPLVVEVILHWRISKLLRTGLLCHLLL